MTVNGVKFDDSAASITVDDDVNGTDAMLKVGMVVKLKGSIDDATKTGVAQEIQYADSLEGPVASKDLATSTLVVFGQTIKVDATTLFEGFTGLADAALVPPVRVEISGLPDNTGLLRASRVENKTGATGDFELKGTVHNFTAGGTTFDLTPPNSTVAIPVSLGTGVSLPVGFGNNVFVEVKTASAAPPLVATLVQLEVSLTASSQGRVEIEGYVASIDPTAKTFVVNGLTVDASTLSMPTVGQKVEVEGQLVNGLLVPAKQPEVEMESHVLLEGNLALIGDVDPAAMTISLNGVIVQTNVKTAFKDGGSAPVATFSLASLAAGDHLRIVGYLDTAVTPNRVVATLVERLPASAMILVQGPVSAAASPNLTILGVTVVTNLATTQYRLVGGAVAPTPADFFAAVVPGTTVVQARGTFSSPGNLNATEVEIEQ